MSTEDKKLYELGRLVNVMVQAVLAMIGESQDTAFAEQRITVGPDRKELVVFVAAPHAAESFNLAVATDPRLEVKQVNIKGNALG